MSQPTVISHGEAVGLTSLVRSAHALGLDVSKLVDEEVALHRKLTQDPFGTQQNLQSAHAALQAAPAGKVDKALEELAEASLKTLAAQALTQTLNAVALSRLRHAVLGELDSLELQAVAAFNSIVEDHGLNAVELPDLTRVVSPIDLSQPQSHAVHVWRQATELLHPLWSLYTRIATLDGHEVGPGGADGLSTNLSLACRLGDAGSFGRAQAAAELFAGIAVGSDAARRYGQLAPFCVPALVGYELHLHSSDEAAQIRRAIQPQAA